MNSAGIPHGKIPFAGIGDRATREAVMKLSESVKQLGESMKQLAEVVKQLQKKAV
jgi:hypothetical protein